jgi:hypothetical protein
MAPEELCSGISWEARDYGPINRTWLFSKISRPIRTDRFEVDVRLCIQRGPLIEGLSGMCGSNKFSPGGGGLSLSKYAVPGISKQLGLPTVFPDAAFAALFSPLFATALCHHPKHIPTLRQPSRDTKSGPGLCVSVLNPIFLW